MVVDNSSASFSRGHIEVVPHRSKADLVIFSSPAYAMPQMGPLDFPPRPPGQLWMTYQLESPVSEGILAAPGFEASVNWTATTRVDSTIPTPYGFFVPNLANETREINYAENKTKVKSSCWKH